MLILPLPSRPDWRKPPVLTLLIMLVCTLVYLGQAGDEQRAAQALHYYMQSDLPAFELPAYRDYRAAQGQPVDDAQPAEYTVQAMQLDPDFLQALHAGQLIRAQQPGYAD